MEITFKNYENKIFNNLSFTVKAAKIYAFIGDDDSNKDKLFMNLKNSKSVTLNNAKISCIDKDNTLINKETKFIKYLYQKIKRKHEEEIVELLSICEIDKTIISSSLCELNNYYLKLLLLIISVINGGNVIVLKEPFYKMNADYENNFIRIIKTLKKDYNITFIILTKNTNVIHKFIDYFFLLDSGNIVLEGNRENLEEIDSKYGIEMPDICLFVNLIRKKFDKHFRSFNDVRDLVKEIYRCTR